MKRNLGRILALCLCLCMSVGLVPAMAAVTTDGGTGSTTVQVTADPAVFSVVLPTSLPVTVKSDGSIVVATDAKIVNNGVAPVEVTGVSVAATSPWTLAGWDEDLSGRIDQDKFALSLQGTPVDTDGSCAAGFDAIPAKGELALAYDAHVGPRSVAKTGEMARVTFVVGWNGGSGNTYENVAELWNHHVDGDEVVLDEYVGTSDSVVVRSKYMVDGVKYDKVRLGLSDTGPETGVFTSNPVLENITFEPNILMPEDASGMFAYMNLLSITGLENLDMSNVKSVKQMFESSYIDETVDLSLLDVSGVVNFWGMFESTGLSQTTADSTVNWDLSSCKDCRHMLVADSYVIFDVSNWNISQVYDDTVNPGYPHVGISYLDSDVLVLTDTPESADLLKGDVSDEESYVAVKSDMSFNFDNGSDSTGMVNAGVTYAVPVVDSAWNSSRKVHYVETRDQGATCNGWNGSESGGGLDVMINSDGDCSLLTVEDMRQRGLSYWLMTFTDIGRSRLTMHSCPSDCLYDDFGMIHYKGDVGSHNVYPESEHGGYGSITWDITIK